MQFYYIALFLIAGGAVAALLCGKNAAAANRIGAWSLIAGSAAGLIGTASAGPEKFFQIPILLLSAAAGVYSPGYLAGHGEKRANAYWFFFGLTSASMLCVTLAKQPLPFLLAWEIMGLSSGALVMYEREKETVRYAAWMYLAACHAGAVMLILFFLFPDAGAVSIVLALAGFGLKIGFPLLHVWLPEAHPAAPAPVSALMSGAMIALGYLGLFRFACTPETVMPLGWSLLILGMAGALFGIVSALPRNNIKCLLAYSSVENMGLTGIAAGLWMLGEAYGIRSMAQAGLCGTVLHILNHALLKGGLFLGAGAVLKSTGTLEMDRLGGLMRRTPVTGTMFALNAAGLCGLPPFNGFIGELLIYCAAFAGIVGGTGAVRLGSFAALTATALTGGIAAAVLAKAVGAVFLGEPRSGKAADAVEVPKSMNAAVIALFCLSAAAAVLSPWIILAAGGGDCTGPAWIAARAVAICVVFILLFALLAVFVKFSGKRGVRRSPTWDCGYAKPDARMEYTGTAFTQPLADFFSPVLRTEKRLKKPDGIFPREAELETEAEDGGIRSFWKPLSGMLIRTAERCHNLQSGNLHFYIVLILLTTGGMLVYAMMKG